MAPEMRRADRALGEEEAWEILEHGEYGILATVGDDDCPLATPLNYVCGDECVYFHCATEGHKLDNIAHNPHVSFCVVGRIEVLAEKFTTNYESAIVFGKAGRIDGAEKRKALLLLVDKYSPEFRDKGHRVVDQHFDNTAVVRIAVEKITGKRRSGD